ncbi:hypothetical protein GCM10010140_39460 [Streptosporangium pseudovulgare]|uniref:Uncharacterized protein n=1 Tax=Streptosporangium pseudovulgare TaxID=35765 RepID=A0ABQ2R2N8_9ACTN|nr:hypothetical protein GCM10010140_39460 [Streptosporangium pseudovulgare]
MEIRLCPGRPLDLRTSAAQITAAPPIKTARTHVNAFMPCPFRGQGNCAPLQSTVTPGPAGRARSRGPGGDRAVTRSARGKNGGRDAGTREEASRIRRPRR